MNVKLSARHVMLLTGLICMPAALLRAQTPAPPPPSAPIGNSAHLEVESVEAHDLFGVPATIRRKAGSFILALTNRSQDPAAWFVVDSAPDASGKVPPGHVVTIGSGQYERKHRSGAVFNAAVGTYQVKIGATGKVICTITIE